MVSIQGFGTYIPVYRIEREAIADQHEIPATAGEIAVPAHDESVTSLAVAAAKNALDSADDGSTLSAVYTSTTTDRFDERGIAPHVALALGARGDVAVADFQGSARAGTNALLAARDRVEAGNGPILVVGADIVAATEGSTAELTAGAAAGAVVLSESGGLASIERTTQNTTGFVGAFKRSDASSTEGNSRFNRDRFTDAASGAIERLDADDVDHVVLPTSESGWESKAVEATSIDAPVQSAFDAVGYAGTASIFVDLALALEEAGSDERILLASYGQGGSDAMLLSTQDAVEQAPEMSTDDLIESKEYVTYAKHRSYRRSARGDV
jgi:hydroxymethylglutaryl-CoA synthase